MKLAIFSDTHGYSDKMINAVHMASPDMIVHLGDGEADVIELKEVFPQIPIVNVRGNCDMFSVSPETELFNLGNLKLFITHGHLFNVKRSKTILVDRAKFLNANIVMYGHTHISDCYKEDGLNVINPGACGYASNSSYAEVSISDSGDVHCEIIKI